MRIQGETRCAKITRFADIVFTKSERTNLATVLKIINNFITRTGNWVIFRRVRSVTNEKPKRQDILVVQQSFLKVISRNDIPLLAMPFAIG